MALTLAEADKYSTNQVLVGVAEITMDQNPLLGLLPFMPIRGNALQYQRELAASAPTFIAAGGTVTEGVPTTSLITTALKILIGHADIDTSLPPPPAPPPCPASAPSPPYASSLTSSAPDPPSSS